MAQGCRAIAPRSHITWDYGGGLCSRLGFWIETAKAGQQIATEIRSGLRHFHQAHSGFFREPVVYGKEGQFEPA